MINKTHGILIGRFQPLHLGHMAVINEIYADGLRPIIFIGRPDPIDFELYEAQKRYPLNYTKTTTQFDVLGLHDYTTIEDTDNDKDWLAHILYYLDREFEINHKDCVLYANKKPEDYKNGSHYLDMFDGLLDIKFPTYPSKLRLNISATQIRQDFENNKHYLDGRVYNAIKSSFQ